MGLRMYEALKEILIGDLHLADANVAPEASAEEAGLDSLAMVELAMVLNKRLGIEITDDELVSAATLGEIAALMDTRVTGEDHEGREH